VAVGVRVACDPAEIGHAAEAVLRVDIEYVFHSHSGTEEETADRVHDALRLARRSRGLTKESR
jgi:hypothetical protein